MYECAQRLKREINGIESLKRQEKYLLAALNLLKLVDKKFAWLAVFTSSGPARNDDAGFKLINNLLSSDDSDDEATSELSDNNLNVDIVEFDEINRQYMLIHSMIRLSSIMSNQSSIGT